MPIPYFNLHDQTAEQLADDLIRQIPAHTPEWRNPAPGDPGRTLIDLFAWMGDKLLYRVNLLPERQRLMFLRLLDMPLRPATPARGLLQLSHAAPRDLVPVTLAARSLVPGTVEFETTAPATILPLSGAVFVKRLPSADEAASVAGITSGLERIYEIEGSAPYVTTPLFSDGQAMQDGFDVARETRDQCLWIALLAAEAPMDKAAFRQAVLGRHAGLPLVLNLGFAPRSDAPVDTLAIEAPKPRPENWLWQMPMPGARPDGLPEYTTLAPAVSDTTKGFTARGVIRLVLPDAGDIGLPENDADVDVLAGVGDRPPRLDSPDLAARLVGWLRLRPRARAETLSLAWLGLNTVEIEQHRTLRNIVLGQAAGGSDQSFALPAASVDADSLVIEVQRADGLYESWTRTDDLAGHGRREQVYQLDAEAGSLRFGNGMTGALPPRGARIRATQLRYGGGRAGNLPVQSLTAISQPRLKAHQPVPTQGGEEAETLAQAETRLPGFLRHGDRAVTAQDFRDLAAQTPGVDLARVEVLPRFRPFQRLTDVAGSVSVLVVPQPGSLLRPAPRPDRAMLSAVTGYLDGRRLIGTELHVIGPEYKPVSAAISVRVKEGSDPARILAEVEETLRLFLAPVAPGGREGTGWALGRTVRNFELEVIAARVSGLDAVYGVNLFGRPPTGSGWSSLPREGNGLQSLTLEAWMLPELFEVVVDQNENGPAETVETAGAGGSGGGGTPIPVVPEFC